MVDHDEDHFVALLIREEKLLMDFVNVLIFCFEQVLHLYHEEEIFYHLVIELFKFRKLQSILNALLESRYHLLQDRVVFV